MLSLKDNLAAGIIDEKQEGIVILETSQDDQHSL
jgi:hypothetical protein